MSPGRISVLVVDDSAFIRKAMKRMLGSDPMIRVLKVIAPGGYHLKIRRSKERYCVVLSRNPRDMPYCPSVDIMMQSIAETWTGKMLGIIMTGMGCDGAE